MTRPQAKEIIGVDQPDDVGDWAASKRLSASYPNWSPSACCSA